MNAPRVCEHEHTDEELEAAARRLLAVVRRRCDCPWNNGYRREPLPRHLHHADCPEFVPYGVRVQ